MHVNDYIDIVKKTESRKLAESAEQADHSEQVAVSLKLTKTLAENAKEREKQLKEAAPQLRQAFTVMG